MEMTYDQYHGRVGESREKGAFNAKTHFTRCALRRVVWFVAKIGLQTKLPFTRFNSPTHSIGHYPAIMSSIINGLHSDNIASDLSNGIRRNGAPKSPRQPRSSVPPSESNAFSDVEGFADDEVVGARGTDRNRPRDPMSKAVPRVVDKVGEKVAEEFESFLEQYDRSMARRA